MCSCLLIAFGVRSSLELLSEAGLCPFPTPSRCLRAVGRTHVNTTLTACSHNWPEQTPGSGSRVSLHGACAPLKRCPSPSSIGSGCSLKDTETMALVTLCLSYLFFFPPLFPPSPPRGLTSRPHPSCFPFHLAVTLIVLLGPGRQGDRQEEPNQAGEAGNIVINGSREAQMSSLNAGNLFLMKNHAVTLNK